MGFTSWIGKRKSQGLRERLTLLLPLMEDAAPVRWLGNSCPAPVDERASLMVTRPLKTSIVVADDEPSMLSLIAEHVRAQGHDVHVAHDGKEAWELTRKLRPKLLLLDVMMPHMSGWEVCKQIRHDPVLASTQVVMITGIGERLNSLTSPLFADAYLDKPFDLSTLDETIAAALKRADRKASAAASSTSKNHDSHGSRAGKLEGVKPAKSKVQAKTASASKSQAKTASASKSQGKTTSASKVRGKTAASSSSVSKAPRKPVTSSSKASRKPMKASASTVKTPKKLAKKTVSKGATKAR